MSPRSRIRSAASRSSGAARRPEPSPRRRSRNEDLVLARDEARVDHHVRVHRVQRLDDPRLGKCALDLLAEAVVDRDADDRRPALREIERVGDVDQHLPGEVLRAGRAERVERCVAVRAVEDELAVSRGVGERHRIVAGRARADRARRGRARAASRRSFVPTTPVPRTPILTGLSLDRARDRDPGRAAWTRGRSWPVCRNAPRSPLSRTSSRPSGIRTRAKLCRPAGSLRLRSRRRGR